MTTKTQDANVSSLHKHIRCELWNNGKPMPIRVHALNTTGIFLRTMPWIVQRSRVTMRLTIPGREPFFVKGRVQESKPAGRDLATAGVIINFDELQGTVKTLIENYLNEFLNLYMVRSTSAVQHAQPAA